MWVISMWDRESLGTETVKGSCCIVLKIQASEKCDRLYNEAQEDSAGKDSAISSARGCYSGYF